MTAEKGTAVVEERVTEREQLAQLDGVLAEYRDKPGALIPVLQTVQELFGYLPEAALRRIARGLQKSYSEVAGVVSFYSFFSTAPRGRFLVRVCMGTACYVRGGKQVLDTMKGVLGIDVGDTTGDGLFSLGVARCFGACGLSPVLTINDDVHQRVKPNKIKGILDQYRMEAATAR